MCTYAAALEKSWLQVTFGHPGNVTLVPFLKAAGSKRARAQECGVKTYWFWVRPCRALLKNLTSRSRPENVMGDSFPSGRKNPDPVLSFFLLQ